MDFKMICLQTNKFICTYIVLLQIVLTHVYAIMDLKMSTRIFFLMTNNALKLEGKT